MEPKSTPMRRFQHLIISLVGRLKCAFGFVLPLLLLFKQPASCNDNTEKQNSSDTPDTAPGDGVKQEHQLLV